MNNLFTIKLVNIVHGIVFDSIKEKYSLASDTKECLNILKGIRRNKVVITDFISEGMLLDEECSFEQFGSKYYIKAPGWFMEDTLYIMVTLNSSLDICIANCILYLRTEKQYVKTPTPKRFTEDDFLD